MKKRVVISALISAAVPVTAGAQVATSEASATAAQAEPPSGGDIVVTAQRRSQSAREVPIAVSALGRSDLAKLQIKTVTSLVSSVPGISGAYQGVLQPFVVIRGISSNSIGIGGEASVGIFTDDAYIGRISAQSVPFLDVERVEILRGPQGSLYGRNSTAGAISIVTRKPTLGEYDLDTSSSYGTFDTYEATASANAPLGDKAAVRLALLARGENGYDRNVTTGNRAQRFRTVGGRLSLRAELSASLSANLSVAYSRDRAGTLPFKTTVADLAAASGVDTDPFSGRFAQTFDGNEKRDSLLSVLTVNGQLSSNLSVKSVTSFNDVKYSGLYDLDGSVLPLQKFRFSDGKVQSFGQEVRFTYAVGGLTLQAGGNLFLERVQQQRSLEYDENVFLPLVAGSVFGTPDGSVPAGALGPGSPTFTPCDATSVALLGVQCSPAPLEAVQERGRYRSVALFAEAEYRLTPTLTVTAGGRYSIDHKRFRYNAPLINSQGSALLGTNPILGASTPGPVEAVGTWRDFQPRGVIRWQPMPTLNLYASVTRGFKSGGFDPAPVSGAYDPNTTKFNPESVWSYEVGLKAALFDRHLDLNLAGYRYTYKGFQVQVLRNGVTSTLNVPQYNAYGLEGDVTVRAGRNLTLVAGGSWNGAKYGDFLVDDRFNPGVAQNLRGNRGILSPEFSGFARADLVVPFAGMDVQVRASGDVNWRSRQYFTIFGDARESQAAYALFGARLALERPDGRWSVAIAAQNLFDTDYLTSAVEQGFGISTFRGRPRSVAVELRTRL